MQGLQINEMQLNKWFTNFLTAVVILFVSLYFVISICVLIFKLTGKLQDGPMIFDLFVPSYPVLFLFQGGCLAILAACFYVRGKYGQKDDLFLLRQLDHPSEYLRPWKLGTLAIGVGLLIYGSFSFPAPDWDIPVSLTMALFAYLTAPWSMRVILEQKWRLFPLMLFFTWFTVDGCYTLYWYFKNPEVLTLMRKANFPASLSLYGICGLVWLYRGSLREYIADVRSFIASLIKP